MQLCEDMDGLYTKLGFENWIKKYTWTENFHVRLNGLLGKDHGDVGMIYC